MPALLSKVWTLVSSVSSSRVEVRSLDSACNPYLAFAVLLAAGLKGIEEGYDLPPETEDDVWSLTDAERKAMGIKPLPASLSEAITTMEGSELVAEQLVSRAGRGAETAVHALAQDRLGGIAIGRAFVFGGEVGLHQPIV